MKINADIVREACHVVWTEGQIDRVVEFYAEDFSADYAFTDWGSGIERGNACVCSGRLLLLNGLELISLRN